MHWSSNIFSINFDKFVTDSLLQISSNCFICSYFWYLNSPPFGFAFSLTVTIRSVDNDKSPQLVLTCSNQTPQNKSYTSPSTPLTISPHPPYFITSVYSCPSPSHPIHLPNMDLTQDSFLESHDPLLAPISLPRHLILS